MRYPAVYWTYCNMKACGRSDGAIALLELRRSRIVVVM